MGVFTPVSTTKIAVTSASAATAIPARPTVVRLYNAGPGVAYIKFGNSADTATTNDMPIPVGDVECFEKGLAAYVAAISDSTATLYVTSGEGE